MKELKMNQRLELDYLGMLPLSENEIKETLGGAFPWLAAAIIAASVSLVQNFGDVIDGFKDGYNGKDPRYPH